MEEYKKNSIFIKNTAGISAVEFFWGLGLPLVLESTFLQLFLAKLGASNLLIGFIPSLFYIGQALLGIAAAYQTRNIIKKRTVVIIYHIIPALVILGFGIFLYISDSFTSSTIYIFFPVYLIFNGGLGLVLPVWQNYLVKLFSSRRLISAFSIMMIVQSAGRLLSSFFIAGYFSSREITARSSALLFIFCGTVFFIGSFAFFITKEPDSAAEERSGSGFLEFSKKAFSRITSNRNLILFVLSDIDMYAVIAAISFYANYAVSCHNVSAAAAAGIFVALNFAGQITANFLFGTFNLFSLKNKCLVSRLFSITGIILIITASGLYQFLAASMLLGVSRAIRSLVYAPSIKLLSGRTDVTDIFAAAPVLMLPLSTAVSLTSGRLLDVLPFSAPVSYRIMFAGLGLLSFISVFFIRRINFTAAVSTE